MKNCIFDFSFIRGQYKRIQSYLPFKPATQHTQQEEPILKKLTALILSLTVVLALTACGG